MNEHTPFLDAFTGPENTVRAAVHPFDQEPLSAFMVGLPPRSVTVTLPDPPSANRWWRMVTIRGAARMLLSSEARKYKAEVPKIVAMQLPPTGDKQRWEMLGPVRVTLDWYRERRSGDLDKRLGVVFDALQGVLYENDNQVIEIIARRHEDPCNPRVQVTVAAM